VTVSIHIPAQKGDNKLIKPLKEAKEILSQKIQAGWLIAINGNYIQRGQAMGAVDSLQDEDKVLVFNPIRGG
jgi:sulfur carrier protein ThiS